MFRHLLALSCTWGMLIVASQPVVQNTSTATSTFASGVPVGYISNLIRMQAEAFAKQSDKQLLNEKLKESLFHLIEHFKQDDPVGLPGAPIPDPMPVPDLQQQFALAKMKFKDIKAHGLSKFRVDYVEADLANLEIAIGISIDKMEVFGTYTMSTWFRGSQGKFDITILDVYTFGTIKLDIDQDGFIEAQDIDMDLKFRDIKMNFENLGFMGSIFQGIVNSVATFMFASIKPIILGTVNENIKTDVNKELRQVPQLFPNSISPLDMALAKVRQEIVNRKLDPYKLPDLSQGWGRALTITVALHDGELRGLSTIHRSGNITVAVEDYVADLEFNIATKQLKGRYEWTVSLGFIERTGSFEFVVDSTDTKVRFTQPANLDKKPTIHEIDVTLGNVNIYSDGLGTADYLIEFGANIFPNMLRNQLSDAVTMFARKVVQDVLNDLDIEELLRQNL